LHNARLPTTAAIYLVINPLNSASKADRKGLFPGRRWGNSKVGNN
jgi:hypothetical protein